MTHRSAALIFSLCLMLSGCEGSASAPRRNSGPQNQGAKQGQVFDAFANNLNRLEDFPADQMVPQMRDFLNHWVRQDQPTITWKADPAIDTLPQKLRDVPALKNLDSTAYTLDDMRFLTDCVWLRDIARISRGDGHNELTIATRLFDWTIRNLQLESGGGDKSLIGKHSLGQILMLGRTTATERAWVFILLCRQQGIDAVMLAVPDTDDKSKLRPWLPAVLVKGELYLFDTRLGLPIPGPDGKPVATLSDVVADDGLLRALDVDADHPYPFKADELGSVVALVEASPGYLSRRMKLVESRLAGVNRVALSTSPTTTMEKLKSTKHVAESRLWEHPFEVALANPGNDPDSRGILARELMVYQAPPIFAGRIRQFKGNRNGANGAKLIYRDARLPNEQIDAQNLKPEQKAFINELKQTASYWLGLMALEEQDYPVAVDYLKERVLVPFPDGTWQGGARYNLGRTYEAMGDTENAIATYEADKSPQRDGNLLRARKLREQAAAKAETAKAER